MVCEPHADPRQAETRPRLIAEIPSQSARQVDMTSRAHDSLSLRDYLLVDSEERATELYRRTRNGWQVETVEGGVRRPRLDVESKLDEVDEGVGL